MKSLILFLFLFVALTGCRLVKKHQSKSSDTITQILESQKDNSIDLNENSKVDTDLNKSSASESEAQETETTTEETFDKEGNLLNRKTTTRKGSSKAKTNSQENLKQTAITQSDLNYSLSEVLKTFGQQHSTSESKVKDVKDMSLFSYIVTGVLLLLGVTVFIVYWKTPRLYRL